MNARPCTSARLPVVSLPARFGMGPLPLLLSLALALGVVLVPGFAAAAGASDPLAPFIGSWKGTSTDAWQFEVRLSGTTDSGEIAGSACWHSPTGLVLAIRLEGAARLSHTGRAVHASMRGTRFVLIHLPGGALRLVEYRPRGDRLWRSLRSDLVPATGLVCAHRFTDEPRSLATLASSAAPVGRWTVTRDLGSISELEVTSMDAAGRLSGRFCHRVGTVPALQILDFGPDAVLRPRYDAPRGRFALVREAAPGVHNRQRFEWLDDGRVELASTGAVGTSNEVTYTAILDPGVAADGCLRWVLPQD